MKIAPVLLVHAIEPVLPLWESLGFARTIEVPHGDKLGFVAFASGNAEVMYQTFESVKADEASALEGPVKHGAASLFIEVDDLDAAVATLPKGTDVFVKRRTTPYGSTETFLRDAAGNVIILAQFPR